MNRSDMILMRSAVSSNSHKPFVALSWGQQSGQFTPNDAIAHAISLIECAMAAHYDALVYAWAASTLELGDAELVQIIRALRDFRQGDYPNCTINLDGERMTPAELIGHGGSLFVMAARAKLEAVLAKFLVTQVKLNESQVNQLILELRDRDGSVTLWPDERS